MGDWVHSFGHSFVSHILLQIAVNILVSSGPAYFSSSAGALSIPGDLPSFSVHTASSTSSFINSASLGSLLVLMQLSRMLV